MNKVLYRGQVWYSMDTVEGVKLSSVKGSDIEVLNQEEFDYALMRGDIKMLEKKMKDDKKIIEIKEEVQIGNVILEKGDKIEVLKEDIMIDAVDMGVDTINDFISDVKELGYTLYDFIEELESSRAGDEISPDMISGAKAVLKIMNIIPKKYKGFYWG